MLSSLPRLLQLILPGPAGMFLLMPVGMAGTLRTRKGEHSSLEACHDG